MPLCNILNHLLIHAGLHIAITVSLTASLYAGQHFAKIGPIRTRRNFQTPGAHTFKAEKIAAAQGISIKRAEKSIQDAIRKQAQWSQSVYGIDESDPSMYDLVVNLEQIDPDEAVRTIAGAAAYRKFKPMTYSTKTLAESALAAKVKTRLLETLSDVRVLARDGKVVVTSKALKRERQKKAAAIKELAGRVEGVEFVEVHLINYVIREAAESLR